ncbi:universal stress protein [Thiohalomonas denitrificans]|uniref:universal stress protein n=1 Tax=Thiohalomonas denitrificans TaxID=415747 RepID=UPI0026EE6C35|nr:universal stress protein [Thiohalomonas denitrificans]
MKPIADILIPLDGSQRALDGLSVATWLGARLEARLHVINAGPRCPVDEALARLGVDEHQRPQLEIHQIEEPAAAAILSAVERYRIGLVIMSAFGESGPSDGSQAVGHITREVIERSAVPVLVLPPNYEPAFPWRSTLVPLSGEATTDESLTTALQLAHRLDLNVAIAHVAGPAGPGESAMPGRYIDQVHHEFAQMLNQLVASACPMCSIEERARIEAFHLTQGDVGDELIRLVEEKGVGLLVLGWHGRFIIGHARVLKRLMWQVRCPILLVKPAPKPRFRLKVGEEFE